MLQREEIIVSSKKDLNNLRQEKKTVKKMILQLHGLSYSENMKYQNKLNRYHNDCGCQIGSFVSVIATVVYVLILKLQNIPVFEWATIAILILVFILSAGIGKFIGILRAKYLFKDVLKEINNKLMN